MFKEKINFKILFLLVMTLFCLQSHVLANTIGPISQSGSKVKINNEDELALKYYDNTAVFCTQFHKDTPAATGTTCSISDNWDKNIKAGVASIINNVNNEGSVAISGNAPSNYYYGELAINEFLCNSGIDTTYTCVRKSQGQSQTILGDYYSWYENAMTVRNSYVSEAKLTFSSDKLKFTKNGDNYVSDEVIVEKNFSDNYKISSNVGTIESTDKGFYVVVPSSSVKTDGENNIEVTASISRVNYLARTYTCGNYQSVTPNFVDSETISVTKKISGNIKKTKLTINKIDGNNAHVSGATLRVTGTKGYSKEFVTNGNSIVIDDLEYDTYTIEEIKAPEGYIIASKQEVIVSDTNLTPVVNITDKKTKVVISKTDATGSKELPGATLQIQDKDGNIVKYCTDLDGNINTECKWVSTDKPYIIEGLPVGKYYLVETIAPEGYVLSQSSVEFEVKGDGTTTQVQMKNELEVKVPDTLSSRSALLIAISMFDIALGIGILTYVKKNKIEE